MSQNGRMFRMFAVTAAVGKAKLCRAATPSGIDAWNRGFFHFLHFVTLDTAQQDSGDGGQVRSRVTMCTRPGVTSRVTESRPRIAVERVLCFGVRLIGEDRA